MRFALLTLVLFYSFAKAVSAEDNAESMEYAPNSIKLVSETEHSAMIMDCAGTPPFRIMDCTFTNIIVSIKKPYTKAELEKEMEAMEAKPFKSETKKKLAEFRKQSAKVIAKHKMSPPERKTIVHRHINLLRRVLACKTKTCAMAQYRNLMIQMNGTRCAIKVLSPKAKPTRFEKTGKNVWMSSEKSGLCSVMTVMTLTRDEGYGQWSFTQTRTGKKGKSTLCNWQDLNKPARYSTSHVSSAAVSCDSISF